MIGKNTGIAGIQLINVSSSSTVNAGNNEGVSIQPPEGQLYKILQLELKVNSPGGTTSGTHKFYAINLNALSASWHFKAESAHGSSIAVGAYHQFNADSSEEPDSDTDQMTVMHNLWASNAYPLRIIYDNGTDVNQTNQRTIKALVLVYQEII